MAVTRAAKALHLQELTRELTDAHSAVVVDYKGLDVPQATELRRRVRAAQGRYRVVKNRIATRAIKDTSFESLTQQFSGTTAIAYSSPTRCRTLPSYRARMCCTPHCSCSCRPPLLSSFAY